MKKLIIIIFSVFLFSGCSSNGEKHLNNEKIVNNNFQESFDDISKFEELFLKDASRWHNFEKTYEDNYLEIVSNRSYSGKNSLKMHALPYDEKITSKVSLKREGFEFKEGDDAWFSAMYYLEDVEDSSNLFLFDLEDSEIELLGKKPSPGRRFYLGEQGEIISDLGKWFSKEIFYQKEGEEIAFPKGQWVKVIVHMYLSVDNGLMEVWQDGAKVLERRGVTLPRKDMAYNRFEIGITANGNEEYAQTLYVDDVLISNELTNID